MKPQDVHSPQLRWSLIDVLYDGGEDDGEHEGDAVAIGRWDRKPVLAIRWNGAPDKLGNPVSTGKATWFVLPKWYYPLVLQSEKITADKRQLAETLLGEAAKGS